MSNESILREALKNSAVVIDRMSYCPKGCDCYPCSTRDAANAALAATAAPERNEVSEQPKLVDLHDAIMNLSCRVKYFTTSYDPRIAYKEGHRDACHAAAELAIGYEMKEST